MPYARLWVDLRVDERWQQLAAKDRADAKALYLDALQYSAEMLADGQINVAVAIAICTENGTRNARGLCGKLASIGMWKSVRPGVYEIADWHRFHSSRADVDRQRTDAADRKRRSRSQMTLSGTGDVTEKSHRDVTAESHRDIDVTRARARAGGQPQQQRQEDPQDVDEGANGATPEPDQPAAADTQVEATRPTRVAEIVQAMPGCDIGSVNRIEPLAVQLPAPVFERIVEKVNQRRNVSNPIGLLKTELERELQDRVRRQRTAAHQIDKQLVVTSSPVERMKRDEPERYVTAMAKVLEEDAMQAYLDEYVTDENTRIVLLDRYHDERRVESVSR